MKHFATIYFGAVIALLVASHWPAIAKDAAWYAEERKVIETALDSPTEQNVEALARNMAAYGWHINKGYGPKSSPQYIKLFTDCRTALLSIPGYERLLTDPVKREWERVMATTDPIDRNGLVHHKLYPALGAFSALSHLPAPASVRAMGDFLFDDRGRFVPDPNRPLDDEALRGAEEAHPVVCDYAAGTLHMLPIVNKPVPADRRLTADDIPAYRRWYRDIAEGRRTFRFEGDPTEYDLDGPASAEKLARIKALREREGVREERRERNKAETPAFPAPSSGGKGEGRASSASRPPYAALLTSGGILLAALAWYILRRGKARPPEPQA